MAETHAKYSPSKLPRLIACPGSAALTAHIEEEESKYAREGTMLHKVTEQALLAELTELNDLLIQQFSLNPDMIEAVNEVLEFVVVLKMTHDEIPTFEAIEAPVTLARYQHYNINDYEVLKNVYGTLDYCLFFKKAKTLYVVDWKFGKGVEVFPDSDQLKAYALGAMATFIDQEIENVFAIIGQPRLYSGEHFKRQQYQPLELTDWLCNILEPALTRAEKIYRLIYPTSAEYPLAISQIDRLIASGEIVLNPSAEACRWCKLKFTCAARKKVATETASEVFAMHAKLPHKTNADEITALLLKAHDLRAYLADLELYVIRQIQQGIPMAHFKMVKGRSLRKWDDEQKMLDYAKALGYHKVDMSTFKIMSPAQAEKKLGPVIKKSSDFKALIVKPEGKATLVLKTDPRSAIDYTSASDKFADYTKTESN